MGPRLARKGTKQKEVKRKILKQVWGSQSPQGLRSSNWKNKNLRNELFLTFPISRINQFYLLQTSLNSLYKKVACSSKEVNRITQQVHPFIPGKVYLQYKAYLLTILSCFKEVTPGFKNVVLILKEQNQEFKCL